MISVLILASAKGRRRWMNENHGMGFSWQEGYGAFTVGVSQRSRTIDYIKRQAEHHQKRSFEEEFVAFLKKPRSTTIRNT
jgi:hypothetical protein